MKAVRLVFSSILLTALCAFAVFGAGKKEAPLTEAAGLRNWEKTFDISDKKPGIYNIVVEGRDQAGNVTVAGPINVYVDPKTDLPVAAIANPIPLMRVSGDLNVVGTCVDDDGVAKVELRLDGSEWFSTQGTTFWSFLYKGTDIADGRHTLWARGVDINGLTGPERSVAFDMDKRRPVETVEQPVAGTLVSGRIALRGSVFDANGVASVECSLDSGKTFAETSGSYDKNKGIRSFVAQIDTNKIPDGPSVVLLKSKDGVGSVALAPILLVVDNTKPTIELISPAAEESVDGTFALFGYAKDEVGLKSVNWKIGDQGGDIVVNPGDPFWVVPVKLSNPRGRETTVILTAVDTIGNRTELRKRIALDLEADKPRVTLLSPAPTLAPAPLARTEGNALLAGFARDDDGVAAIEYWIDSQAPKKIETSGTFCIRLTDIPPGKRMLSVRAIDINGVVGPTTATQIEDIGAAPSVEIKDVVYDSASKDARVEPFQSGVELAPDGKASFRFIVKNSQANGSKIPAVEWKLTGPGGAQGVSGTAQVRSADGTVLVPLPKDSPFGMLELTATVKDSHSRGASAVGLVRVLDYSAVRGAPGFIFADERLAGENTIRFAPTDHGRRPLRGRFVGAVLSSLSLDPASSGYDVSFDGPYISLTPKGDGVNGKFTLVAKTDRGHEFRSRE
ncbi:MAG: Ig-like domain-containing protein, partial [Treponemataceae bacterium]